MHKLLDELPDWIIYTKKKFESEIYETNIPTFDKLAAHVVQAYNKGKADGDDKRANSVQTRTVRASASVAAFYTTKKRCYICGSKFYLQKSCPDKGR